MFFSMLKRIGACLEVDKNGILLRRNCTEFKTGCPKSDYYNYDLHKCEKCFFFIYVIYVHIKNAYGPHSSSEKNSVKEKRK